MSTGVTYYSKPAPPAMETGDRRGYPVAVGEVISMGDAVGENGSGFARRLHAGDVFLGFAEDKASNLPAPPGSSVDTNVRVKSVGRVLASISGLSMAANNRPPVYMSDHETFTLSPSGNSLVGYVSNWDSDGLGVVEFDSGLVRAALHS